MALVDSHAHENAPPASSGIPFPVLLYNHGYSGFPGVHQVLFEDLASHGYIVVSVGHAHESALFVLPDGTVRAFDPDHAVRRSRLDEAHGDRQEAIKDAILRAPDLAQ